MTATVEHHGRSIVDALPLSPMQLGMLLDHVRGASPGVDVEQIVCTMLEPVQLDAMRAAWEGVVARHEALRTSFSVEDASNLVQVVHPSVELPFLRVDLRRYTPADREGRIDDFLAADRRKGFDLTLAPAMRVALFDLGPRDFRLVWTFHHIILDGRSIQFVLEEALRAYDAHVRAEPFDPPMRRQFREHVLALAEHDHSAAEAYFREQLAGLEEPTPLPLEGMGLPAASSGGHGEVERVISQARADELRQVARRSGATLHNLVQAAWAVLLARYSGRTDVVFGGTRAGRRSTVPDADSIVGLFINTLPVRADVSMNRTVRELLEDLRTQWIAMRPHEQIPLARIRELTTIAGDRPLFQSFVVFETYDLAASIRSLGGTFANRSVRQHEQSTLPLGLAAYAPDRLILRLEYDRRLYSREDVERMLEHLDTLLESMAENEHRKLGDLRLLTAEERRRLVYDWNRTERPYPRDRCIHELVHERAERTPRAIAVRAEGLHLTYHELVARARVVGTYLRSRGVGPGSFVGLAMPRGIELTVALLGILESGAAFVPLDPAYPRERLGFMIADAKIPIVLTIHSCAHSLPSGDHAVVEVDRDWAEIERTRARPAPRSSSDDIAYVIYTSGTTGVPKGVPIRHRSVVNHAMHMVSAYGLKENDRVPQFSSISFDIAVEEIFPTWLGGGTLVMRPEALPGTTEFVQWLDAQRITVLQLPTAYFHEWVHGLDSSSVALPDRLRLVVIGGERASPPLASRFRQLTKSRVRLVNAYGPTEATVTATMYEVTSAQLGNEVPIGRPISNTRVYVLDEERRLVPIGAAGELYISGDGLTPGYLQRPEATEKKLVECPYEPGALMYRTGDRVRYRPDGNIEFLGRVDDQVKVRGFRIELGEVEQAMRGCEGVEDAVAVAMREGSSHTLVGYVVLQHERTIEDVRTKLERALPYYMVPTHLVQIETLPKTPNGKVDRDALPPPPRSSTPEATQQPRNLAEITLHEIWREVLGLESVGVHDNFFRLGGHSLQSIRVLDRANKMGLHLTPMQFFEHPTIAGLAAVASVRRAIATEDGTALVSLRRGGTRPPIYFMHSLPGDLLGYGGLVHELGEDQPCFGFQSIGLSRPADAHVRIDQMAKHYAAVLMEFQPDGPYHLVGWCFGAHVTIEMARILAGHGRPVGKLVLMEAFPRRGDRLAYVASRFKLLAEAGPTRALSLAIERAALLMSDADETAQFALNARSGPFANRPHVYELNYDALEAYFTDPFDTPIYLVRGDDPPGAIYEADYGWSRFTRVEEVVRVPAQHETILQEPHVAGIAAKMRELLKR